MHAQYVGFFVQILRVLAVFRGSVLLTADTSGLAVVRDFATVDTPYASSVSGSVLRVLQVLAVFRPLVVFVLRVLAVPPNMPSVLGV